MKYIKYNDYFKNADNHQNNEPHWEAGRLKCIYFCRVTVIYLQIVTFCIHLSLCVSSFVLYVPVSSLGFDVTE